MGVGVDEAAALRATIAADPAADLPRLVYADWLEDGGDDAQAAMIRAQVQLAREPAWSPLAVRCRHHTPDVLTGRPWRRTLPEVSPRIAEWHPETPFRRGLPDWLVVRDLASFLEDAARLFAVAPITTLSLPTSSLGYWQDFARQPWLRQVRALHFYGVSTPIEPLRVLANAVNASAVESLTLERTSGPAFPVVLSDLFQSDLGKRLKHLDLRAGGDNEGEWVEALEALPERHPLESLELRTMELGGRDLHEFARSSVFAALQRFRLHNDNILRGAMRLLLRRDVHKGFTDVTFSGALSDPDTVRTIACSPNMSHVRRLDLSRNPIVVLQQWSETRCLDDLKSLNLSHFRLRDKELGKLVAARWWFDLVELDLSGNPLTESALRTFLEAEPPTDLVALRLSGRSLDGGFRAKLQDHFRGAVVFADES